MDSCSMSMFRDMCSLNNLNIMQKWNIQRKILKKKESFKEE